MPIGLDACWLVILWTAPFRRREPGFQLKKPPSRANYAKQLLIDQSFKSRDRQLLGETKNQQFPARTVANDREKKNETR